MYVAPHLLHSSARRPCFWLFGGNGISPPIGVPLGGKPAPSSSLGPLQASSADVVRMFDRQLTMHLSPVILVAWTPMQERVRT